MRAIICIVLLAAVSCGELLRFQVHLENQKKDISEGLKKLVLNKSATLTTLANQSCKQNALCNAKHCNLIKGTRTVQKTKTIIIRDYNSRRGRWDQLGTDGWICLNVRKTWYRSHYCKDAKFRKTWNEQEVTQTLNPECNVPISVTTKLVSIDALELDLDNVEEQCVQEMVNKTQKISCVNVTVDADWTMNVQERGETEDVRLRSVHAMDMSFFINDNNNVIRYGVDESSKHFALISTSQLTKSTTKVNVNAPEITKITNYVTKVSSGIAFQSLIGPNAVRDYQVTLGNEGETKFIHGNVTHSQEEEDDDDNQPKFIEGDVKHSDNNPKNK